MTLQPVTITTHDARLLVRTPYNADFVDFAKRCSAKWDGDKQGWAFDARDEARVRAACMEIYGADGRTSDTVTLRVTWTERDQSARGPISVAGRSVARAQGRDSGARIGDGVVLLHGGFSSGGSMKNWTTTVSGGTVILLRDFPRVKAEALLAEAPDAYAIEPEAPVIDRDALIGEREWITARLAEIERLLGE